MHFLFFILVVLLGFAPGVGAQDFPPAVPAAAVEAESLPAPELQDEDVEAVFEAIEQEEQAEQAPLEEEEQLAEEPVVPEPEQEQPADVPETNLPGENAPIVVELFSSQACVFCPKADALLSELSKQEKLIALDCHVDYFDVKTGALSIPFCSSRQAMYEAALRAGPKYTPQIVINGRYNAVGYRRDEVLKALEKAAQDDIVPALIVPVADSPLFDLELPAIDTVDATEVMKIWLIVFDRPHAVSVAEGGNNGKDIVYEHIVSNAGLLDDWDGSAKTVRFDAKLSEGTKGFAVLVQDQKTGQVVAAVQHIP